MTKRTTSPEVAVWGSWTPALKEGVGVENSSSNRVTWLIVETIPVDYGEDMNGATAWSEGVDVTVLNAFSLQVPQFQSPEVQSGFLLRFDSRDVDVLQPVSVFIAVAMDRKEVELILIIVKLLQVGQKIGACVAIGGANCLEVGGSVGVD
jgi:hypothetical protein